MPTREKAWVEADTAYRKARWTLLGHAVFMTVCTICAVLARRFFKMPPALIGVAFIVALILFGGDIMRFIRCRDRLRRLTAEYKS